MVSIGPGVYFQKMSSQCSVNSVLNAQMYFKLSKALASKRLKHFECLLLILGSVTWDLRVFNKGSKKKRARAETRGKRTSCRWAQLESPPPLSMQFCGILWRSSTECSRLKAYLASTTPTWLSTRRGLSPGGDITQQIWNKRIHEPLESHDNWMFVV